MDVKLQQMLLALKQSKDVKVDVPGFKGEFEPHQRVGVAFGVLAKKCLILDFVGAGKTIEAIGIDLKTRSLGDVRRTLVVCQGGKRRDWHDEYRNFTDLNVYVVDGNKSQRVDSWLAGQSDTGVTVANYEAVRGDFLERIEELGANGKKYHLYKPSGLLQHVRWDLVIFDEVSIFKGWESVLADSLNHLVQRVQPEYVLGLSATPVQKTLEDLHSIMDKVVPGLLGAREEFESNYCIKHLFERYQGRRRIRFNKVIGYKNEQHLASIMEPYFIRREKQEVYGDRLKHVFKIRRVQLTPDQSKAYKKIQSSIRDGENRGSLLQAFGQMERVCDTMAFLDQTSHTSAKLDDLRYLLTNELCEEKVVIFSKWHKTLEEIESQILQPEAIRYIRYTGREEINKREDDRRIFLNDPAVRVALVTTAAEMGFNFHSAHYMIFMNHIYNPARVEQLIGRIDRPIVQKSNFICTIHYICENTFEENVVPRLHREADLMKKLFGASNRFDNLQGEFLDAMDEDQLLGLIKTGNLIAKQTTFMTKNG